MIKRQKLGNYLRALRELQGLTLDKVSKDVNFCTTYLSEVERGAKSLSPELLLTLSSYYDAPELYGMMSKLHPAIQTEHKNMSFQDISTAFFYLITRTSYDRNMVYSQVYSCILDCMEDAVRKDFISYRDNMHDRVLKYYLSSDNL